MVKVSNDIDHINGKNFKRVMNHSARKSYKYQLSLRLFDCLSHSLVE